MKVLALVLPAVFFVGCASTLSVTYHSDPAGATLYEGTHNKGMCPVTVEYEVPEQAKARGRYQVPTATARWVSGASRTDRYTANLGQTMPHSHTILRPRNAPNLQVDAQFAAQVATGKAPTTPVRVQPVRHKTATPPPSKPASKEVHHPRQTKCHICGGKGGYGKCDGCLGTGKITKGCQACVGSGKTAYGSQCPMCDGKGYSDTPCTRCTGTGFAGICPGCNGLGYIVGN